MVTLDPCTVMYAPVERCFDLARSIEVHILGTEQTGEQAIDGVTSGLIGPGQFVCWRARHLGIKQRLSSQITAYDRPVYFQDTMIEGAFKFMQHDHLFREVAPRVTEMRDHFVFAAPLSILGILAERLFLRRYTANLLLRRNDILKRVAESDRWISLLSSN